MVTASQMPRTPIRDDPDNGRFRSRWCPRRPGAIARRSGSAPTTRTVLGLSDGEEVSLGTRCDRADTDGDGLTDSAEVMVYRLQGFASISPTNPRSLHAVYQDYAMVDRTDSDQETIPDRIEEFHQLDPTLASDGEGIWTEMA